MKPRVVVAMSGGVDSSVAAARLLNAGMEVIGITMNLGGSDSRCCSLDDKEDARRVAETLGIPFYVANYKDEFRQEVIEPFAESYLRGETPIPCVACNRQFKFRYLLDRARVLGAESVATGHYLRLEEEAATGRRRLFRAVDRKKDQTYFLFDLTQDQLKRVRFPLGSLTKDEVRAEARRLGLVTADKEESQDICFVPDGDYASVVEKVRPNALPGAGKVVTEEGEVIGEHEGIHRYTIGQRKGIQVASTRRLYVKNLELDTNRIVVAEEPALFSEQAMLRDVSWISGETPEPVSCQVQVRYRHAGVRAVVEPLSERAARVQFEEPVRAITPGQAAVFYREDELLGGGWIERESQS